MRNYVKKLIILYLCISVLGTYVPLTASANAVKAAVNEDTENPSTPEEPTELEEPSQPMLPVLTGKLSASQTVTLQWTSEEEGNTYLLSRVTSKTGTYEVLTSVTSICGTQSYKDTHLSLGKTYYYKLSLVASDSNIYESNTLSIKVRLLSPSNVTTSVSNANDVTISWKKVSNASGYTIYRSTSKSGTYTKLKSTTKTSYKDTTPTSAKAYYYKIYAYRSNNSAAKSAASTIVAAYTKPSKPTLSSVKYTSGKVTLRWKNVTRATTYYIYRLNSKGNYTQIGTSKTCSYTDKSVKKNIRYKYKVKAAYTADKKIIKGASSSFLSI